MTYTTTRLVKQQRRCDTCPSSNPQSVLLRRLTLTAEPCIAQAETDVTMMLQDFGQLVVSETSQCFQLSLSASHFAHILAMVQLV